jgi:hypothetical protein
MGVIYTDPGKRDSRTQIPGCVLLRKNFQNGIPAHSITEIPLVLGKVQFS